MDFLLRRHIWVVDLIGIGIGAALLGDAAATRIDGLLAAEIAGVPPHARPMHVTPSDTSVTTGLSDARSESSSRLADGVRKTGTHRYEVRRALVDPPGGLTPPWPRAIPEVRDGRPVGIRLSGIRSGSPAAVFGLSNGDLLLEVNGRSLATPDDALAAYSVLRTSDHIWLQIERDGRPLRLDYVIR
jgi:general secretion pathway protein C